MGAGSAAAYSVPIRFEELSPEERRKIVRAGRRPEWWIRNALGFPMWGSQARIARSVARHRNTVVRSCNAAGKTAIAARIVLWFLFNHRPAVVLTTAPTARQVRRGLWKEISVAYGQARFPLGGRLLTESLELAPNWFALGFTSSRTDANTFAGIRDAHVLVVQDEACGMSSVTQEAIEGVTAAGHAVQLAIGNPLDPNTPFGRSFGTRGIAKIGVSAFDTPNFTAFDIRREDLADDTWQRKIDGRPLPLPSLISPSWAAEKWWKWGDRSPAFLARVDGEFPDGGPEVLVPRWLLMRAHEYDFEPSKDTRPILSLDVARFGDDFNVLAERRGARVRIVDQWTGLDTMVTTGRALLAARARKAEAIYIDAVGIGSGVVDRLREIRPDGIRIEGVNFGAGAKDSEQFLNVRAECFWALRKRMEDGLLDLDPDDDDTDAELTAIRWKPNSGGRIQIESKESMRERGIASPNRADALALAFADQFEEPPLMAW